MPIFMSFVDGGLKLFAILAPVLVSIEMPIADTNLHSSMVDDDRNDQGAIPVNY